jgi:NADH:ubiquinone oxidoreductase subunit K
MNINLMQCLVLAAMLFGIGLYGLFTKRNLIAVLMCIEIMLNAVNINFVAFNHFMPTDDITGQLMAVFSIMVGAAEVAVGLALAFRIYHDHGTVQVDELDRLRG